MVQSPRPMPRSGSVARVWRMLATFFAGLALFVAPMSVSAQERTPADDLTDLRVHVTTAIQALASGDVAGAQAAYTAYDDGWDGIEDGIRDKNRDLYRAIESRMDDVKSALLRPDSPDPAEALAALQRLDNQIDAALPDLR